MGACLGPLDDEEEEDEEADEPPVLTFRVINNFTIAPISDVSEISHQDQNKQERRLHVCIMRKGQGKKKRRKKSGTK